MKTPLPHYPNTIVVYRRRLRDWFQKSFWVVCIRCDADDTQGPFITKEGAQAHADLLNRGYGHVVMAGSGWGKHRKADRE